MMAKRLDFLIERREFMHLISVVNYCETLVSPSVGLSSTYEDRNVIINLRRNPDSTYIEIGVKSKEGCEILKARVMKNCFDPIYYNGTHSWIKSLF